jgi:hypothetical protein
MQPPTDRMGSLCRQLCSSGSAAKRSAEPVIAARDVALTSWLRSVNVAPSVPTGAAHRGSSATDDCRYFDDLLSHKPRRVRAYYCASSWLCLGGD